MKLRAADLRRFALNRWTLQLLATSGFILIALLRVDLQEVGAALRRAEFFWAAAAVGVLTLSKLIAAARWRLYLTDVGRPPLLGLMGAYVIGTFLNTILPLRAGDVAKIQIVAARYSLPRSALSSTVFVVEAVLDLVTLLALLLVGLAFLDTGYVPALVLWPFVFLAGGAFVVALLASHLFPQEMPQWRMPSAIPYRLGEMVRGAWPGFRDGMAVMRRSRLLGKAFSLHVTEWLLRALVLYLFGLSFELDAPLGSYLILTVMISVFTLVPVTFMNIGTYQVIVTEVLGAAGVPRSEAFAYAVTAQALSHAWVILMGIAALLSMRIWPPQVRQDPPSEP